MNYYRYHPAANQFASLGFEWDIDSPEKKRVIGVHDIDYPVHSEWTPPIAFEFEDDPPAQGDFPSLSTYNMIPIMSQRASAARTGGLPACSYRPFQT